MTTTNIISQGIATDAAASEILDILRRSPENLRHALQALASEKRLEANLQRDQKRLLNRLAAEIAAEKDESGKPKYSNETARNAAIQARVEQWGEMRVIGEQLDQHAKDVSEAEIEVEYRRALLSAARAAALLLAGGERV